MNKKKFLIYLGILSGLLLIFFLFTLTHRFVIVSGDSMEPTLQDGEIVLSSTLTTVNPGEVYLIREPEDELLAIKRLIGVPGDHIQLVDGATYRNGELFMDAPGDSWDNMEWNLGVDEYLFIGDNRAVSYDGRFWSRPLKLNEILFELDLVIFPFGSQRNLDRQVF